MRGDIDIERVRERILSELEEPKEKRKTLTESLNELAGTFRALRGRGFSWEKIWNRLQRAGFEISRRHFLRIAPRIVGEPEKTSRTRPVRKEVKPGSEQKNPDMDRQGEAPVRKKELLLPEPKPAPGQSPPKSKYRSHFELPEDSEL